VKRLPSLVLIAALLCAGATMALAEIKFPPAGTSYQDARAALQKQGVTVKEAPYCVKAYATDEKAACFAIFREKTSDGWTHFIMAELDSSSSKARVKNVRYAPTASGLEAIPPPNAKDIPKLKGPYYPAARNQLLGLGYKPMQRLDTSFGRVCLSYECKRIVMLPEADCSGTGYSYCHNIWLAPDGRVLVVITAGETAERLYRAFWTTRKDVRSEALTVSANPRPRPQRN
jgi:hypothetical protein